MQMQLRPSQFLTTYLISPLPLSMAKTRFNRIQGGRSLGGHCILHPWLIEVHINPFFFKNENSKFNKIPTYVNGGIPYFELAGKEIQSLQILSES